jgi:uncharacterized RDD family membrane protein YckC
MTDDSDQTAEVDPPVPQSSDSNELIPAEVSANYDSSIMYRRFFAACIDSLIILGIFFLPPTLFGEEALNTSGRICFWIAIAYFPIAEGMFGATIGKFVAQIRVVDATGRTPGLPRALMRSATRVVEVNPFLFGGLPAAIIILNSRWKQRWGDMLAGTFILTKQDAARFSSIEELD